MKHILTKNINGLGELKILAAEIQKLAAPGSTFLLDGDLAAGKTSFVSAFCELHNISDVSSPTYSIHNRYKSNGTIVDHFDLYRLENSDQLESSGFYDLCNETVAYRFIEWPERAPEVESLFSEMVFRLNLVKTGEDRRKAELFKIS